MASRHLARSIAIQSLYEWDFFGQKDGNAQIISERNIQEFGQELQDINKQFIRNLVNGVAEHLSQFNTIIEKAAPDWPLDQITLVDRNVLRLGLFELLFEDKTEVPPKVAINKTI